MAQQKNLKQATIKKTTKKIVKFKPAKIHIVDPFNNMTPKAIDELWDKALKIDENEQALFDRYKLKKPTKKIPNETRILIYKMAKELGYWKEYDVIDLTKGPGRPGIWQDDFGRLFYKRVVEQKDLTPKQTLNACIGIVQKKYKDDYGAIPLKTLYARWKEVKKTHNHYWDIFDALKECEPELQELAKQIQ